MPITRTPMNAVEPNAHPPRPQWELLESSPLMPITRGFNDERPVWASDELGAHIRDLFKTMGLSVGDEGTIWTVFAVLSLQHEAARALLAGGAITRLVFDEAAAIHVMFAQALLPYIPEEVRRA